LALDEPVAAQVATASPIRNDDWAAQQRVRSLGRELRRHAIATGATSHRDPLRKLRVDPPQDLLSQLEQATSPSFVPISPHPTTSANSARTAHTGSGQVVAWLVVAAGAIAMAAGIGLTAWSIATDQLTYWNLALGVTLGGQGTLILGLVLVVSRLWRNSRYASSKLQEVYIRLGQLQNTADALTAMRSGGAPAFYADLVRGASPHVLLANLKGQVDQLAARVGSGL
jgi:hypothetical protein